MSQFRLSPAGRPDDRADADGPWRAILEETNDNDGARAGIPEILCRNPASRLQRLGSGRRMIYGWTSRPKRGRDGFLAARSRSFRNRADLYLYLGLVQIQQKGDRGRDRNGSRAGRRPTIRTPTCSSSSAPRARRRAGPSAWSVDGVGHPPETWKHADALNFRGTMFAERGAPDEACDLIRRALGEKPDNGWLTRSQLTAACTSRRECRKKLLAEPQTGQRARARGIP